MKLTTKEELDQYAKKLRDEFRLAYVKALRQSQPLEDDKYNAFYRNIVSSFDALIAKRDGWTRNQQEKGADSSLTFRNGMRLYLEPSQSENRGMFMIDTAKKVARIELEEYVDAPSEARKTELIQYGVQTVEKGDWIISSFERRRFMPSPSKRTNDFRPWNPMETIISTFVGGLLVLMIIIAVLLYLESRGVIKLS